MVEKKLFWGQTLEMEILTDLRVLKSPESENHIFRVSFIISITQKQITEETSNFFILLLYHILMLLKTFYKDRTKNPSTGAHKIILIHYGLFWNF